MQYRPIFFIIHTLTPVLSSLRRSDLRKSSCLLHFGCERICCIVGCVQLAADCLRACLALCVCRGVFNKKCHPRVARRNQNSHFFRRRVPVIGTPSWRRSARTMVHGTLTDFSALGSPRLPGGRRLCPSRK
jgi:hypothetical protein